MGGGKQKTVRENKCVVQTAELEVETIRVTSRARLDHQEKGSHPEPNPLKKAGWSIECLKDKFITTKNLHAAEECKNFRNFTQQGIDFIWKDLSCRIEEEEEVPDMCQEEKDAPRKGRGT